MRGSAINSQRQTLSHAITSAADRGMRRILALALRHLRRSGSIRTIQQEHHQHPERYAN